MIDLAKNVYYKYDFNENEEDDFYDDDCDGCDDYDYYLDNLSNQNYSDKDGLNKNLEKFYKNNLNKKLRVLKGIIDLLIEE